MPTLGHCNVEPSLLLELVGMETRSGSHGRRPPLSETKEGKILSQDLPERQQHQSGKVSPIMRLVCLKTFIFGKLQGVGILEEA